MLNDPIVKDVKKKKKASYINPYEVLSSFGEGTKQQAKDVFSEVVHELFAIPKKGDLSEGQELNLSSLAQKKADTAPASQHLEKKVQAIRPAMEYMDYVGDILKSNEKQTWKDSQAVQKEIQELVVELKGLASSTKQLEKEITEATGQTIVSPGKYHKTFFRWLIAIVRDARIKIDNASVWLTTTQGKSKGKGVFGDKKKSQTYWDMAEKHGTKFTLSGERGIATQAA